MKQKNDSGDKDKHYHSSCCRTFQSHDLPLHTHCLTSSTLYYCLYMSIPPPPLLWKLASVAGYEQAEIHTHSFKLIWLHLPLAVDLETHLACLNHHGQLRAQGSSFGQTCRTELSALSWDIPRLHYCSLTTCSILFNAGFSEHNSTASTVTGPCTIQYHSQQREAMKTTKGQIFKSFFAKGCIQWHFSAGSANVTLYIHAWYSICNEVCKYRREFLSQTSDDMDRWKSRGGTSQRGEKQKREDQRRERVRRKKMHVREKVGKLRDIVSKHCVFTMICGSGSGGSKSRLAKAAGAEPCGHMRDEKLHAVVARSTFRSQNAQSTPLSDHFWKLRCRKSARRCGAKQISKSKCTKHLSVGPLLEVEMSKKCTPLWREAHFQVKINKAHQLRSTFGS